MRIKIAILILCCFYAVSTSFAEDVSGSNDSKRVFSDNGNIFFSPGGDEKIQLTKYGKDSAPVLSPDGKKVAFLRKSKKEAYLSVGAPEDYLQSGPDAILADQLWIIDVDGSNEMMLVEDKNPDVTQGYDKWKGQDVIAHIDSDSIKFSPDSKRVYFITSAWVTSGAVHGVNVDGTNEKFITGGSTLDVIYKGQYKGNLITNIHKYFLTGGSYDWWWVVTPDGEEVGPLGDDLDTVDWDFLYSE